VENKAGKKGKGYMTNLQGNIKTDSQQNKLNWKPGYTID